MIYETRIPPTTNHCTHVDQNCSGIGLGPDRPDGVLVSKH